jgi:hypothetical protein
VLFEKAIPLAKRSALGSGAAADFALSGGVGWAGA